MRDLVSRLCVMIGSSSRYGAIYVVHENDGSKIESVHVGELRPYDVFVVLASKTDFFRGGSWLMVVTCESSGWIFLHHHDERFVRIIE